MCHTNHLRSPSFQAALRGHKSGTMNDRYASQCRAARRLGNPPRVGSSGRPCLPRTGNVGIGRRGAGDRRRAHVFQAHHVVARGCRTPAGRPTPAQPVRPRHSASACFSRCAPIDRIAGRARDSHLRCAACAIAPRYRRDHMDGRLRGTCRADHRRQSLSRNRRPSGRYDRAPRSAHSNDIPGSVRYTPRRPPPHCPSPCGRSMAPRNWP